MSLNEKQFVLGPFTPPEFETWKRIQVNDSLCLSISPELSAIQVRDKERFIICLGFVLDPDYPELSNEEILKELLKSSTCFDEVLEQSDRFGGRWILVAGDSKEVKVFNDASGLRQLFYTHHCYKGELWCASHPNVIARILGLKVSPDALDFINKMSEQRLSKGGKPIGRWWPGDGSPYEEVKHLLPNHYLDLCKGVSYRFWPREEVEEIPLEDAVGDLSKMLRGFMLSAYNHFDKLTLLITAGWDSRLVLAASKDIADKISYLSIAYPGGSSKDIEAPALLLKSLGLNHIVAQAASKPSVDFHKKYEERSILFNEVFAANAEAILPYLTQTQTVITGHGAEIFKGFYKVSKLVTSIRKEINPEMLTYLATQMDNHPFAVKSFRGWLTEVNHQYNYDILDLFYWEQRAANWLPSWLFEYDLVWNDCVVAFNSRHFLRTALSVEEKTRKNHTLHRRLILALWPEILSTEPANKQPSKVKRIRRKTVSYVSHTKKNIQLLLR